MNKAHNNDNIQNENPETKQLRGRAIGKWIIKAMELIPQWPDVLTWQLKVLLNCIIFIDKEADHSVSGCLSQHAVLKDIKDQNITIKYEPVNQNIWPTWHVAIALTMQRPHLVFV